MQYMAFRELCCLNPMFLRLLLSKLEKNVNQHIYFVQDYCVLCNTFSFYRQLEATIFFHDYEIIQVKFNCKSSSNMGKLSVHGF